MMEALSDTSTAPYVSSLSVLPTDLFGSITLDKFLIDFLGLFSHFDRQFDFLVFFTSNPELNVLLTELRSEEVLEAGKSTCREKKREKLTILSHGPMT